MKGDAARIAALGRDWPAPVRLAVLHGPDEAASRDIADALVAAAALPVTTLPGARLRDDPQALVAAATSLSMFAQTELVRIDGLDDDGLPAVEALLAGPAGHPVVAVAGTLRRGGRLLALAERDPAILACISYEATARDAPRLAAAIAAPLGLSLAPGVAETLFDRVGGDRGQLRREIEKYALYKDAAPDRPARVDDADLDALAPGQGEAELFAPVAAITAGDMAQATDLLGRLPDGTAIPLLRAVHRRLALLAGLRAEVDRGRSPADAVASAGRAIFFREKDSIIQALGRWTTPRLAAAMAQLLAAERAVKASGGLADLGAHALLFTITRAAARGAPRRR